MTKDLCSDCPPAGYPTDKTRCYGCPLANTYKDATGELVIPTAAPTSKQDFEPCYCVRCDGKLPAPCRYDQGTQSREERVLSDAIDMCEGWSAHVGGIGQEAIAALRKLRSELSAPAQLEFKNFHRLLCERFGYVHDEKDWRRDQLSLIEHIAKRYSRDGWYGQHRLPNSKSICLISGSKP